MHDIYTAWFDFDFLFYLLFIVFLSFNFIRPIIGARHLHGSCHDDNPQKRGTLDVPMVEVTIILNNDSINLLLVFTSFLE